MNEEGVLLIEKEIARLEEDISSLKDTTKWMQDVKIGLNDMITVLSDLPQIPLYSFTVSGLKFCYENQLVLIDKRIDSRKKYIDQLEQQKESLEKIINVLKSTSETEKKSNDYSNKRIDSDPVFAD